MASKDWGGWVAVMACTLDVLENPNKFFLEMTAGLNKKIQSITYFFRYGKTYTLTSGRDADHPIGRLSPSKHVAKNDCTRIQQRRAWKVKILIALWSRRDAIVPTVLFIGLNINFSPDRILLEKYSNTYKSNEEPTCSQVSLPPPPGERQEASNYSLCHDCDMTSISSFTGLNIYLPSTI